MATRFYFPSTGTPDISPTLNNGGEWEHVNGTNRLPFHVSPARTSALGNTAYSPDAADHHVNGDALLAQLVCEDRLIAQTINAQTVSWQWQCLESNAGNNVALTLKIFIVSEDGTSIKETLLAIRRDASEMNTALRNISDSATISSATVEDGDRIVIEIGCGGTPTAAGGVNGHNCTIRFGEDASSGDLPVNETETGTTFRPWLEFAENLLFRGPVGTGLSASALKAAAVGALLVSSWLPAPAPAQSFSRIAPLIPDAVVADDPPPRVVQPPAILRAWWPPRPIGRTVGGGAPEAEPVADQPAVKPQHSILAAWRQEYTLPPPVRIASLIQPQAGDPRLSPVLQVINDSWAPRPVTLQRAGIAPLIPVGEVVDPPPPRTLQRISDAWLPPVTQPPRPVAIAALIPEPPAPDQPPGMVRLHPSILRAWYPYKPPGRVVGGGVESAPAPVDDPPPSSRLGGRSIVRRDWDIEPQIVISRSTFYIPADTAPKSRAVDAILAQWVPKPLPVQRRPRITAEGAPPVQPDQPYRPLQPHILRAWVYEPGPVQRVYRVVQEGPLVILDQPFVRLQPHIIRAWEYTPPPLQRVRRILQEGPVVVPDQPFTRLQPHILRAWQAVPGAIQRPPRLVVDAGQPRPNSVLRTILEAWKAPVILPRRVFVVQPYIPDNPIPRVPLPAAILPAWQKSLEYSHKIIWDRTFFTEPAIPSPFALFFHDSSGPALVFTDESGHTMMYLDESGNAWVFEDDSMEPT